MPKRKEHWRTYTHPRYKKMRWKTVWINGTTTETGLPSPPSQPYEKLFALENTMINKVILIGNLGADPEVRFTQNGTPVATFRIATTERWKGQDGEMHEQTEWHNLVAWRRLAEICGEYLAKGARIYVEGKLQTRKWQDQHGNDRYTTEIVVKEMKMLTPRSTNGTPREETNRHQDNKNRQSAPLPEPPPMSDDVPF